MRVMRGLPCLRLAAVACWLAACGSDPDPVPGEQATLGVMLPLTGSLADVGLTAERVVQVALAEINDHGGVLGRPLRTAVRDTQEDAQRSADLAVELMETEGTDVIVAGMASSIATTILDAIEPLGGLMVNSLSGAHHLSERPAGTFFRTLPVHDDVTALQTWWSEALVAEGHRRVLYITGNFYALTATSTRAAFLAACMDPECGVEVRSYADAPYVPADLPPLVADVMADPPDAIVVLGGEADTIELLKLLEQASYTGDLLINDFFGGVGSHFIDLLQADTVNRLRWADVASAGNPEADLLRARFRALHGVSTAGGRAELTTYDAVMVAALAIERAQSTRTPAVKDALVEVANAPGTVVGPFDYARAVELLAAGEDIDYQGLILSDFDAVGENLADPDPAFFGWDENGEVIPWVAN